MANVLVRFERFAGGAPLSLLEYVNLIKEQGHSVISIGEFKYDDIVKKYRDYNVDLYHVSNARSYQFFKLFKNSIFLYKFFESNKVNLIISTSIKELFFCSKIAEIYNIKLFPIIAGGEMKYKPIVKRIICDKIICFSEENKERLIEAGHPIQNVFVISNRISATEDSQWIQFYKKAGTDKPIKLLMITRLDSGKVNSVKFVINLAYWLIKNDCNIELHIAGDGKERDNLKTIVNKINSEIGREVIFLLGHISDLNNIILESHIIFGKGRSVLEPIMKNRVGIVVGDNNTCLICNIDTIENLYKFNFSGRNIEVVSSNQDILEIVNQLCNKTLDYEGYYKVFNNARLRYHATYLKDKFMPIFMGIEDKIKDSYRLKKRNKYFDYLLLLVYCIEYTALYIYGFVRSKMKNMGSKL